MPLTREESNVLKNRLTDLDRLFHAIPGSSSSEIREEYIIKCVNNFTENQTEIPKREIQVGDIYKDGVGNILVVESLRDGIIFTSDGDNYYMDGRYSDEREHEFDLILSRRYKLVEIEDE